jgi:hypothetical protein
VDSVKENVTPNYVKCEYNIKRKKLEPLNILLQNGWNSCMNQYPLRSETLSKNGFQYVNLETIFIGEMVQIISFKRKVCLL